MTTDVLVPLTVVVGEEDLLVGRAVGEVVRAARQADPQADVRDLYVADLQPGDLPELLSPSLFGDRRVVVLRGGQDLAKPAVAMLVEHASEGLDEVSVVVCHAGGQKGKAGLTALLAGPARRVDVPKQTKLSDRRDFVRSSLRAGGRQASEGAVALLLDAVGSDLRELCAAAEQLQADTEGPIDTEVVSRYHRGRADLTGFAIADKAVDGDLAGALELTRYGQATGLAPVLVTSALASTLRSIAQVASAGHGSAAQVASALGMPPWKVDKTRKQARGWRPESVAVALHAVADADLAVKGAAADRQYAVECALLAVVAARQQAR